MIVNIDLDSYISDAKRVEIQQFISDCGYEIMGTVNVYLSNNNDEKITHYSWQFVIDAPDELAILLMIKYAR